MTNVLIFLESGKSLNISIIYTKLTYRISSCTKNTRNFPKKNLNTYMHLNSAISVKADAFLNSSTLKLNF